MRDVAGNARREHRLGAGGEVLHAGVRERVGETHRVHEALVGDDAVHAASGVLRVRARVHRHSRRDRCGDIGHAHDLAVARLQPAAVAPAVIHEVYPRLFGACGLRVVEGARDERGEIPRIAHIVRGLSVGAGDVAVRDDVLLGMHGPFVYRVAADA